MKLLTIWFCGNQSMAKGTSEDRLETVTFVNLLEAGTRVPRDYLLAAMDDKAGWRAMGGWTEVVLVVVVVVIVV